ncbi:hypothetical protein BDZ89DRAFT_1074861 [Hymenopellis radicata]|nr:hypothetical protein BDZ89DRAFT_1074861 [Hymenopellis radicata]
MVTPLPRGDYRRAEIKKSSNSGTATGGPAPPHEAAQYDRFRRAMGVEGDSPTLTSSPGTSDKRRREKRKRKDKKRSK